MKKPFFFKPMTNLMALLIFLSPIFCIAQIGEWITQKNLPMPLAAIDPVVWNGKIYVFGGKINEIISSDDILVFDPAMEDWTSVGKLPDSLEAIAVEVLNDKIYLIGGHSHPDFVYRTEIMEYNPVTNVFDTIGNMPVPKAWFTTVVLNGKIYIIGGDDKLQSTKIVDIFDPISKTWETTYPLLIGRAGLSADTLNGKIYVTGGGHETTAENTMEIYDPANGWTLSPATMLTEKGFHAMKTINGHLYVFGGAKSFTIPYLNTVEYFDPALGIWMPTTSMITPRRELGAISTDGHTVYVIGGVMNNFGSGTYLNKVEKSDITVSSREPIQSKACDPQLQSFPNPFDGKTTLSYHLYRASKVVLSVYNSNGHLIRTLVNDWQLEGDYKLIIDISNEVKGYYIAVLQINNEPLYELRLVLQ